MRGTGNGDRPRDLRPWETRGVEPTVVVGAPGRRCRTGARSVALDQYVHSRKESNMAIAYERLLPDWPGFMLPDRWRRLFDVDGDKDGWLRMEEYYDGNTLVLRAEVPGIDPEKDVEITVSGGVLRFHAHRELKEEHKSKKVYRSEFRYGDFWRTVRLPDGVTGEDLKATYEDGILELRIPIAPAKEPEVKTVPVTKV
jgi:HSP20 family protein